MVKHELKIFPIFFEAVERGEKTFEVRRNDRGFQVGDLVILKEWDPKRDVFTGRKTRRKISYLFEGGSFGVDPEFVVFSIVKL